MATVDRGFRRIKVGLRGGGIQILGDAIKELPLILWLGFEVMQKTMKFRLSFAEWTDSG